MKNIRNFEGWRAEEIAKVYLLNTELVDVFKDASDKFDFIAVSKTDFTKKVIIEVKATKYNRTGINARFAKTRESLKNNRTPALIMYINYDNEKGFYQIISKETIDEIKSIETIKFKKDLERIINE